jgi:bifunctional non-homologous end joining protein LigD
MVHEIKHDGYRLIARKDAGRVVLWSRYGTDYSDTFSRIAEAVRVLPVDHVMIDWRGGRVTALTEARVRARLAA